MIREKSAGVVIFRRNPSLRFLLLHYPAGHWDFVKGHVEPGEDEIDTVIRETREETGISQLEFIFGFREEIEYYFRGNGELHHKRVAFYLAETNQEDVRISHEHLGYAWLDYESALERLTFKNSKDVLRKAWVFLKKMGYI